MNEENQEEISLESFFATMRKIKAKTVPIRRVPIVTRTTQCKELFSCLFDSETPVVIVVDDEDNYYGLLTPKEFLVLLTPRHSDIHDAFSKATIFSCTEAEDLANTGLPKIKDDDPLKRVAELMAKYETIVLPRIKDKGEKVKGIIFLQDVIKHVRHEWSKFLSENEDVKLCPE